MLRAPAHVTYHQQVTWCGKPNCRRCREGKGHGPYWYAYQTVDGRLKRSYIGKTLPESARAEIESAPPALRTQGDPACLRVYTLGQFRLERRSEGSGFELVTDTAWQHQRVRSLLSCLVSGSRRILREQIMEALWPDLDPEEGSSHLDRAVYSLRKIFEPGRNRPATSPLLLTEREVVILAEQPVIWIDADEFEQKLTQAHETSDPGEREHLFEEAAILYGGDFLPEERELEWALARRESLRRRWVGMLLALADLRIARDAQISALEPLDRLLSVDPTNEAAVQRLMRLLAQIGRRGEALRAYKRLAALLHQEYRIAPLPETRALYEAVREGHGAASPAPWRLLKREGDAETISVIGRVHQSPLVGREQELEALRGLILTTEQEIRFKLPVQKKTSLYALDTQCRPQCVLLMGEVGIGKTRLAEEVSRDARRRGWAVVWSRAYAQEGSIPYRLWTEVLRQAMARGAWHHQELCRRPLVFAPLVSILPELESILPEISFPSPLSAEQEQLRLWEAVRELLSLVAEGTPLLVALDDLHWADNSSCELLAYLACRVQNQAIVIVGTCREHELPTDHPLRQLMTGLQRERAVERIQLLPLSHEQIDRLVSYVPHLSERIARHISERAAGNPFFAEELARGIEAQGFTDSLAKLPETISAVLDLRLSRLSLACQRLLAKAAVLGGAFEFQIITEMEADSPASNEESVLKLLEEALSSGMLIEEGIGTHITYQFWHPLLQSHLYERLSAARRARLHRRAADILRKAYQRLEEVQTHAATITHHLVAGGADDALIVHYAELAGDHAYGLSAYPDAEHHYTIAFEHLDGCSNANQRLRLLMMIGNSTRFTGKCQDALKWYEQALACGVADGEVSPQMRAALWGRVGRAWYDLGNHVRAQHYYDEGKRVLCDAGMESSGIWSRLLTEESYLAWREGRFEEAWQLALDALNCFNTGREKPQIHPAQLAPLDLQELLLHDPMDLPAIHNMLGMAANALGRIEQAPFHFSEAMRLYQQRQNIRGVAIVCCNVSDFYIKRGEYSQAVDALMRALSLVERYGRESSLRAFTLSNLGWCETRRGNLSEAETVLHQSLTLHDAIDISMAYGYLAAVHVEQGRLEAAADSIHEAFARSRAHRSIAYDFCMGLALVALGNLRIAQARAICMSQEGDWDGKRERILQRAEKTFQRVAALGRTEVEIKIECLVAQAEVASLAGKRDAERQARHALAEAQRSESVWLVVRAERILGTILFAQGERAQAKHLFEEAREIAEKRGMRLEYGRTLLEQGQMLAASPDVQIRQEGIALLEEAHHIFKGCQAALDVQIVEHALDMQRSVR
jgi:DNA-binding SARP family transcriptional activator/Tfp pilus assembly protein PilF